MSDLPANAYGRSARAREVATPSGAIQTVFIDEKPRCNGHKDGFPCRRLLAEMVTRPWRIKCAKCGTVNVQAPPRGMQTSA